MQLFRLVFGILMATPLVCASSAQDPHGFALELAPSQNATPPGVGRWKVGAPVLGLIMKIRRTVHYALKNAAFDYEMDVRDASGKPATETESFRKLKEQVKKGSVVGEYSIQVRRELPDEGLGFVKSNRIQLTITP